MLGIPEVREIPIDQIEIKINEQSYVKVQFKKLKYLATTVVTRHY